MRSIQSWVFLRGFHFHTFWRNHSSSIRLMFPYHKNCLFSVSPKRDENMGRILTFMCPLVTISYNVSLQHIVLHFISTVLKLFQVHTWAPYITALSSNVLNVHCIVFIYVFCQLVLISIIKESRHMDIHKDRQFIILSNTITYTAVLILRVHVVGTLFLFVSNFQANVCLYLSSQEFRMLVITVVASAF